MKSGESWRDGYAFVRMAEDANVKDCIKELNGTLINHAKIRVKRGRNQEEPDPDERTDCDDEACGFSDCPRKESTSDFSD